MTKFRIEVSQRPDMLAFKHMKDVVRTIGSHFVTHAVWSQRDRICTGVLTVETQDRSSALSVVPPSMRSHARISRLEPIAPT